MNWTTEYPTQPGLYWISNYRYKHYTGSVFVPGATIVELDADLDISFVGAEELHKPDYIASAEWFGPIQPPQENDDYEWNDETGCSFAKSWCSAKAVHKDELGYPYCEFHWKWEQIYKKREAKAQENDK